MLTLKKIKVKFENVFKEHKNRKSDLMVEKKSTK